MKSIEWIIKRTCIDKKSFSREEADDIVDRKAELNQVYYWYKCQFCQRYHLSRQAESENRIEIVGGNPWVQ